jgi:hypothetical protein
VRPIEGPSCPTPGLVTATPSGPGATTTLGPAATAHDGIGTLPLAQTSLDRRASGRADGGSPASQLAVGIAPVTATGRAILASGLAAPAQQAKAAHKASPAHHAKAGHRAHLASTRHTGPCATSPCTGGSAPPSTR